jgi:hypothetical protein
MITDEQIIEACQSSLTMAEACSKVGLHYNTFKARASLLEVYLPFNKSGKGTKKPKRKGKDSFS